MVCVEVVIKSIMEYLAIRLDLDFVRICTPYYALLASLMKILVENNFQYLNRPWWPSGLRRYAISNSRRKNAFGPRLESSFRITSPPYMYIAGMRQVGPDPGRNLGRRRIIKSKKKNSILKSKILKKLRNFLE